MSEKIYSLLLRLYPSRFREAYGEEALLLFRDRARDERGPLSALRLWADLLADFFSSLPREYFRAPAAQVAPSSAGRLAGATAFAVLETEPIRPAALLLGAGLGFAGLALFGMMITAHRNPSSILDARPLPPRGIRSNPGQLPPNAPATAGAKLDAEEKQRVIEAAVEILKQHYASADVAQKMAEVLQAHEKNGEYDSITDSEAFAHLLTAQLREVSHDPSISLDYSVGPIPESPRPPSPDAQERYRRAMQQQNCTFEKVQILQGNIGYLKFNWFPEPSVCESTARSAMASLNNADAVIFDLRDNRGGDPDMVALIAAYLFDHPEYWFNPRENTTVRMWTRSPVPGNKLAAKPIYVLTSHSTLSGAEHFCYDLKVLKRATLVGETTGGAEHAGAFHRIDEHFWMGFAEVKAINPYPVAGWEGTGVEPDVKVPAANALETAQKLATTKLR